MPREDSGPSLEALHGVRDCLGKPREPSVKSCRKTTGRATWLAHCELVMTSQALLGGQALRYTNLCRTLML